MQKVVLERTWPQEQREASALSGRSQMWDHFVTFDSSRIELLREGDRGLGEKLICALLQLFESLVGRCS
jgi:hypothetical protein